jgi:hypothetical protein
VRPNPNFGSLISTWLVSWVGPPTIGSSFDNSPVPVGHRSSLARGPSTSTNPRLE